MSRAPFRIEALNIRNFRGIKGLDLAFEVPYEDEPGGLVVLAGDNGCGKTTVLEAILLALGRQDLLPADAAPLAEQVRFGAADFEITATVYAPADGQRRRLRATSLPAAETTGAPKPNVEYYSARREPEAGGEALAAKTAPREAERLVELKRRLRNAYVHGLRAGTGGAMPEASPFTRLERFVQRFLGSDVRLDVLPASNNPGADFEVILRDGELPVDITSLAMARSAAVDRKDIPTLVPIDRLSSGEVALFAFAGPLVFRDAPADVVLVDEPEQHLHMRWARYIVSALRELSPESQIIVATHSMDVIESALSYERHLLLRDGDPRVELAAE